MTVSARRDPAALYRKVMQEAAVQHKVSESQPDEDMPTYKAALRQSLRADLKRQQHEYAAHLAQREAAKDAGGRAAD